MRKIDEGTLSKSGIAMSSLRRKSHRIHHSILKLKKSVIRKNEGGRIPKCVEKPEEFLERVEVQGDYNCLSFSVTTIHSINNVFIQVYEYINQTVLTYFQIIVKRQNI